MSEEEIIYQIKDLIRDRESCIEKNGDLDIYEMDKMALERNPRFI